MNAPQNRPPRLRTHAIWTRTLFGVALCSALAARVALAAEAPPGDEPRVYLFSSFEEPGSTGLRFLWSKDGLQWERIPGVFLAPHAGGGKLMRDPSVVRGPDGWFHMVWTTSGRGDHGFGYSTSQDLVHWLPQRFLPVMEHEPDCVNVWAPELFYDESNEQFVICWASTIPGRFPDKLEPHDNNQRLYFTTTRDFKELAPTRLFFEPGFSVIDGAIVKSDDDYILLHKDNTRPERNLRVAFSKQAVGPWRHVSAKFTQNFTEGPTALRIGDRWLIYFDAYQEKKYGVVETRDFRSFLDVSPQASFPADHKHGTVLPATQKEVDYLIRVGNEQIPGQRLPVPAPLSATESAERLQAIDRVARQGPFYPNWESLQEFETPAWYRDAKLGIFIHWGAYSVPGYVSEWYPRNMYRQGSPEYEHHLKTYGPHAKFGYKEFIKQFKAEKFDPDEWATLFKEAGARYVIPVAEHHDGFPMYDSELSEWTAAKKGPCRDVLGELGDSLRRQGLVVGASSHRAEHWWFFDGGMTFDSDVRDPANAALYGPATNKRTSENQSEPPDQAFLDDWLLRTCEIVDKYRPEVVYFDWWICQPVFQPYLQRFAAFYYNRGAEWGRATAINFKQWEGRSFPEGTGVLDIERGAASSIRPDFWQTCTSVSKTSWGYVTNHEYKDVDQIVDALIDVVSKNGTLLLNIGPQPDGRIPEQEQRMLRELGSWLKINGEAIYGSRPWLVYGEGPTRINSGSFGDDKGQAFTSADFRFTTKDGALYAIALAKPNSRSLIVASLAEGAVGGQREIGEVRLLGSDAKIPWQRTSRGLEVQLPEELPCDYAVTLRIQ
ncbi:MAG: alpha-L-fucosidase [Planctomycetales bacterium]|nr:alpha-L-fucosidase [Planctomycetales bacterium]